MEEGTEPQEQMDQTMQEAQEDAAVATMEAPDQGHEEDHGTQDEPEQKQVPLSALRKERQRRKELEEAEMRARLELEYMRRQQEAAKAPAEDDESQYEPITQGEFRQRQEQIEFNAMRNIEEKLWKQQNPEKAEMVDEHLKDFLKQRPHLASAIGSVTNRYEEAYLLMTALSPKQQREMRRTAPTAKESPGNPAAVPKAAGVNQAVDVMSMTDEEYSAWRKSKKKRR